LNLYIFFFPCVNTHGTTFIRFVTGKKFTQLLLYPDSVPKKKKKTEWSVVKRASTVIGFEDKILQSRHENNKKAVQAFEAKYQELVTKMNGDYDKNEKSSSSSDGEDGNKGKSSMLSQRPKPFPHVIHFIEDCQNEKLNLLHDGDFHFGNDVPIWHFRAAMDALIAGARMADSPASFRMSHRKYSHQETVALEEFLVTEDIDIEHFGLDHVRTKQSAGCNFAVCLYGH
jgi:hypothetical protein